MIDALELMDCWWYLKNNSIQAILWIQQCRYRISESWSKIHEVLDGSSSILKDIVSKCNMQSIRDTLCWNVWLIYIAGEIVLSFSSKLVLLDLLPTVSLLAVTNSHVSWRICSLLQVAMYIFAMYTIMKHFPVAHLFCTTPMKAGFSFQF